MCLIYSNCLGDISEFEWLLRLSKTELMKVWKRYRREKTYGQVAANGTTPAVVLKQISTFLVALQ